MSQGGSGEWLLSLWSRASRPARRRPRASGRTALTAALPVCCASASTKRRVMRQKRSWSPLLGKMGPEMGSQNSGSRISTCWEAGAGAGQPSQQWGRGKPGRAGASPGEPKMDARRRRTLRRAADTREAERCLGRTPPLKSRLGPVDAAAANAAPHPPPPAARLRPSDLTARVAAVDGLCRCHCGVLHCISEAVGQRLGAAGREAGRGRRPGGPSVGRWSACCHTGLVPSTRPACA
jgi:hypothetical protein